MSIATKRYLSNPFSLSFYKQMSEDKYKYKEITYDKNQEKVL